MDIKHSVINLLVFAAIGFGAYQVYLRVVDRTDEIIEAGETASATLTYKEATCPGKTRRIEYKYSAEGIEYVRPDKVECDWEIPSVFQVVYVRGDAKNSRALSPLRAIQRTNLGK